jgi:hypothetical protein
MSATQFKLINRSSGFYPADVMLSEPASCFDEQTMLFPWLLIRNCSEGFSHPFSYEQETELSLRDDCGNFSSPVALVPGLRYYIQQAGQKQHLVAGEHTEDGRIEIFNDLAEGAPAICIQRSKRLTACRSNLVPGEIFSFRIPDALYFRKCSGRYSPRRVRELQADNYSTLLPAAGLLSADVVMTGGGYGAKAQRYSFHYEHVIKQGML